MAGRISMGARREVVSAVMERYRSAKRAEKGRILDALCATTGWHRKHAVRALRQHEPGRPNGVEYRRPSFACHQHGNGSQIGRIILIRYSFRPIAHGWDSQRRELKVWFE